MIETEDPELQMSERGMLTNGNGAVNSTSRQEESERRWSNAIRRFLYKRKTLVGIIIITVLLAIFIIVSIVQSERLKEAYRQLSVRPSPSNGCLCPQGWLKNEELCYFFSDHEMDWNSSQSYCASYGGSLVTMDNPQEVYWLGLRRETTEQPWKAPNNSVVIPPLGIKGDGLCASLNHDVISSTFCDNTRHFICKKSIQKS